MKVVKVVTYNIEATEEEINIIKDNLAAKVNSGTATPTETNMYTFLQSNI